MAKEKFERTKPHVNVGTIGHVQKAEGPAGLTFDSAESETIGNPPNSYILTVDAPATSSPESATVIIPLDDEFFFHLSTGPAVSMNFSIDVLPLTVEGTNDVDVSLGILQGEFYLARATPTFDPPRCGTSRFRSTVSVRLRAHEPDFNAALAFATWSGQYDR